MQVRDRINLLLVLRYIWQFTVYMLSFALFRHRYFSRVSRMALRLSIQRAVRIALIPVSTDGMDGATSKVQYYTKYTELMKSSSRSNGVQTFKSIR